MYARLRSIFEPLEFFFHVIYPIDLSVIYFSSLISLQNSLASFGMPLCILHLLFGKIFFRSFVMSCFVCFSWACLFIFWVSLLLLISFDLSLQIVLSDLSSVYFWSFHPNILLRVFSSFAPSFVVGISLSIPITQFPMLVFVFLFRFFKGAPVSSQTSFASA